MKKRWTALLLALAFALGLALPAAAEGTDAALQRVTEVVKDTLDLDTEGYDTFRGDRYEGELSASWTLRWSGTEADLTIQAQDDGTITNYRLSQDDYVTNTSVKYRPAAQLDEDMERALEKMSAIEQIYETLPALDCGFCGAPTCRAFAEDVVRGACHVDECIVRMRERMQDYLRKTRGEEAEP